MIQVKLGAEIQFLVGWLSARASIGGFMRGLPPDPYAFSHPTDSSLHVHLGDTVRWLFALFLPCQARPIRAYGGALRAANAGTAASLPPSLAQTWPLRRQPAIRRSFCKAMLKVRE